MKILLVDAYALMRVGLTVCLQRVRSDLELGEASTLAEALACLDQVQYDLVILSLALPDSQGAATADAILKRPSSPHLVICTGFKDEHVHAALMDSAARAIIKKEWPLERQVDVLAFILRGIDAGAPSRPAPGTPGSDLAVTIAKLSPRRREVLELICRGYRNKEIARALQLGENTVKIHVRHILRMLGASSRIQAALMGQSAVGAARTPPEASDC